MTASPVTTAPEIAARPLRMTLYAIAVFQFALGAGFLISPAGMAQALGRLPAFTPTGRPGQEELTAAGPP